MLSRKSVNKAKFNIIVFCALGDAYLIVAGVPIKSTNHAVKICDMAFDMMDGIRMLKDPGTGKDVQMRIGCHSGPVVAGIVGLKMPRSVSINKIRFNCYQYQ